MEILYDHGNTCQRKDREEGDQFLAVHILPDDKQVENGQEHIVYSDDIKDADQRSADIGSVCLIVEDGLGKKIVDQQPAADEIGQQESNQVYRMPLYHLMPGSGQVPDKYDIDRTDEDPEDKVDRTDPHAVLIAKCRIRDMDQLTGRKRIRNGRDHQYQKQSDKGGVDTPPVHLSEE